MDCADINEQLDQLQAMRDAAIKNINDAAAVKELAREFGVVNPSDKPKKLRTYTGDVIEINPADWWGRANKLALEMGSDAIRDLVSRREQKLVTPDGANGSMINYGLLEYAPSNQKIVLELLGKERLNTKKGVMLTQAFTESIAAQEVMAMAKTYGGNPRDIADRLQKDLKGLDKLPINMVMAMRGKLETSAQLAQMLDDIRNLMDAGVPIDSDMKLQVGNATRWAVWYEQMDAAIARRVGQALRSRQFRAAVQVGMDGFEESAQDLLDLGADLNVGKPEPGSLRFQIIEAIENGDKKGLKKLATAARMSAATASSLTEPHYVANIQILNKYRKDNLFSSINTWGIRNPGAMATQAWYMGEDLMAGFSRLQMEGVNPVEEFRIVSLAGRAMISGMTAGFQNAKDHFLTGKQTFAARSLMEEAQREMGVNSGQALSALKAEQDAAINRAFAQLTTPNLGNIATSPVAFLTLMNAGSRKVVGGLIEKKFGTDVGYYASFRALGAFDEVVKKMAFDWKVNHENLLRATMEAKDMDFADGKARLDWINETAEARTREAVFSGVFNDEDLAAMRRTNVGMPAGMGMDSDTLRLKLFNDMVGTPRLEDEVGAMGSKRADDVTFTGSFDNPATKDILNGVQLMRQNPVVGWALPVFRTPANGLGWLLRRDPFVSAAEWMITEIRAVKGDVTPSDLADARARAGMSWSFMMGNAMLWSAGIVKDGGSLQRDQRKREMDAGKLYSFSVPGVAGQYVWFMSGKTIDLFDLQGLQLDLMRAAHEGTVNEQQYGEGMLAIGKAYMNTIKNKSTLESVDDFMSMFTNPEYGVPQFLGDMTGGVLPWSGLQGNVVGLAKDAAMGPGVRPIKRTYLDPDQARLLEEDQLAPVLRPVVDILEKAFRNTLLEPLVPTGYQEDWKGRDIKRPLNMPIWGSAPFATVGKPKDPVDDWLLKHGFGDPQPRADRNGADWVKGQFPGSGIQTDLTMTLDEQGTFYKGFNSTKGKANSEALLKGMVRNNPIVQKLGGLDQFVAGNTWWEAMNALRLNPEYNKMLESTARTNPSRTQQPFMTLAEREKRSSEKITGTNVYGVVDAIYMYYDHYGMEKVWRDHPDFSVRAQKLATGQLEQTKNDDLIQQVFGLTRR